MKYFFIICIFILSIILFLLYPRKKSALPNQDISNYPLYKTEYKNRYLSYSNKYPELSFEEVIIKVNLNLDKPFYTDVNEANNLNTNYTLVNKYYFLNKDYIPDNLELLDTCTAKQVYLVADAKNSFITMCTDMKKNNLNIRAISGYRSYYYQENLYNKYVESDGVKLANTYSAKPGFSEHQLGLVVDVDNGIINYTNFEKTEEFNWLKVNAHKYGFILRYPQKKESITGYSYESWHYRYVGSDIATVIYNENITFDEYYVKYIDK